MTLQQRLVALAQAVGGDVKTLLARSQPPGGTVGQVLTKTGAADYASGWATPPHRTVRVYSGSSYPARPAAGLVEWVGPVEPGAAGAVVADNDLWTNNT